LNNITRYTYDANGDLTAVNGPQGARYTYTYDSNGNLTSATDALGLTTQFTYNANNDLTSYTDAEGNTTGYTYDKSNDLLSVTYANGTQEQYTYNPLGEATQFVNANGNAISSTYNSRGLVATETFADGSSNSYTYDAHGNMLTTTSSVSGTIQFLYQDAANPDLLTEVEYPNGQYLKFTYNSVGQRIQSIDQTGFTVNYTYNDLGQLAELTDGQGNLIVQYIYDAAGNLQQQNNGNGTFTAYTYDADGNVLSITNYAPSTGTSYTPANSTVNSFDNYTYDALGNVLTDTNQDGQWTYTYDADSQLIGAVFTPNSADPDGLTAQNIQYVYGADGNRISQTVNGVTTTYVVNAVNEYTSSTTNGVTTTYAYDSDGNLISQTIAGSTTSYSYNELDELTGMSAPGQAATYTYDALGDRTSQTVNGVTTQFQIGPDGVESTYNGSGSLLAHYTYGYGLVSAVSASGSAGYYDFDLTGNTVGITGATGSYVNKYAYLPFGQTTTIAAATTNLFTFVGAFGVMQDGAGLFNMQARAYSTVTGQFLSNDPLGLGGGDANIRRYVANNPLNGVDPTGTEALTEGQHFTPGVLGRANLVNGKPGLQVFFDPKGDITNSPMPGAKGLLYYVPAGLNVEVGYGGSSVPGWHILTYGNQLSYWINNQEGKLTYNDGTVAAKLLTPKVQTGSQSISCWPQVPTPAEQTAGPMETLPLPVQPPQGNPDRAVQAVGPNNQMGWLPVPYYQGKYYYPEPVPNQPGYYYFYVSNPNGPPTLDKQHADPPYNGNPPAGTLIPDIILGLVQGFLYPPPTLPDNGDDGANGSDTGQTELATMSPSDDNANVVVAGTTDTVFVGPITMTSDGPYTTSDFTASTEFSDGQTTQDTVEADPNDPTMSFNFYATRDFTEAGDITVETTIHNNKLDTTYEVGQSVTVVNAPIVLTPLSLAGATGGVFNGKLADVQDLNPDDQTSFAILSASAGGQEATNLSLQSNGGGDYTLSGTVDLTEYGPGPVPIYIQVGHDNEDLAQGTTIESYTASGAPQYSTTAIPQLVQVNTSEPAQQTLALIDTTDPTITSASQVTVNTSLSFTGVTLTQLPGGVTQIAINGTANADQTGTDPVQYVPLDIQLGNEPTLDVSLPVYSTGSDDTVNAVPVDAIAGQPLQNVQVATLAGPINGKYSATINWGDGETSTGQIVPLAAGQFGIFGSKPLPYSGAGDNEITVTVSGPGVAPLPAMSPVTISTGPSTLGSQAFTVGQESSFAVTVPNVSASSVTGLPAGLSAASDGSTLTISGTPLPGSGGIYPITIPAGSGSAAESTLYYTLTVAEPPTFTSPSSTTFTANQANTFVVTASGFNPAQAMHITHGALPSWIKSVTDNGNGTATIVGTPTAPGSTATITLTASNDPGSATQTLTINVDPAPTFKSSSGSPTFTVGKASSFGVTVNAGFPSTTTFTVTGLPKGLSAKSSGNTVTISGTPPAGSTGTYPIVITASSGSAQLTLDYMLNVDQVPAFTSPSSTIFVVGQTSTFTITTTGFGSLGMQITHGTLPAWITSFTNNGDGTATIVGTPTAPGTAAITLTASNGDATSATQTLTIKMDEAPTFKSTSGSQTFTVGKASSFGVTVNAGYPAATFSVTGLPKGLVATSSATAVTISGVPAAGTGGTYPITITASTSSLTRLTLDYTLTVDQAPAFTSAASSTFTAGQAGNFTVKTTGFPTAALTESGTLPAGVTFVDNGNGTATLAGIPQAGSGGRYVLTLKATNGTAVVQQSFTLTVNQPPVFTSPSSVAFPVNQANSSFTFTTTGFPVATLRIASGALPPGLTFTNKGNGAATLSGKPTAKGTFTLEIEALAGGVDVFQEFTVTVN